MIYNVAQDKFSSIQARTISICKLISLVDTNIHARALWRVEKFIMQLKKVLIPYICTRQRIRKINLVYFLLKMKLKQY